MKKEDKTIAISGYFIWLHQGHIDYINEAAKKGEVICIVNNDKQQELKYGEVIVPMKERIKVLSNIKNISKVVESIDEDRTVRKTLEKIKPDYFGNGGDRNKENVPEDDICDELKIKQVYGLGKKIQASSSLMNKLFKMNIDKKLKELNGNFNKVNNRIEELMSIREQIRGQVKLLQDQKENEKK